MTRSRSPNRMTRPFGTELGEKIEKLIDCFDTLQTYEREGDACTDKWTQRHERAQFINQIKSTIQLTITAPRDDAPARVTPADVIPPPGADEMHVKPRLGRHVDYSGSKGKNRK